MSTRYEYAKPSRNDPFYEPPLHKAFYHPSSQQDLPDDKKWVALSSDRMRYPPDARDVHFLKATHTFTSQAATSGPSPGDETAKFDESWPVSEQPTLDHAQDESDYGSVQPNGSHGLFDSSPMKPLAALIKEYASLGEGRSHPSKTNIDLVSDIDITIMSHATSTSEQKPRESTLSKYIERFRHGAPLSREDREQLQRTSDPADFWWLSGSSPRGSSTPRDVSRSDQASARSRVKGHQRSLQPRSKFSTTSESSRTTFTRPETDLDSETRKLNDKTDRESSLDSSAPVVSTVGLGSDTSTTSSCGRDAPTGPAPRESAYLPSFVRTGQEGLVSVGRDVTGGPRRPLNPADDILYQWRQQRRLEGIRNKAARLLDTAGTTRGTETAESRLADFRRKVSGPPQGVLPDASRDQMSTQHKECDEIEKENQKKDQLKAQVDAVCQTSLDAEGSAKTLPEPVTDHAPITSTLHSSPIASPLMSRRKLTAQSSNTEVEPHFHLSCDVIPCPHGHGSPRKQRGPHGHKPRSYHSDTDTDESNPRYRGSHSIEEPVKDIGPLVIDSCSDFEYENYKRQHLEELSRELEACSSQSETVRGRTEKTDCGGDDKKSRTSHRRTKEKERGEEERRQRSRSKERERRKESGDRAGSREKGSDPLRSDHRKADRSRSREDSDTHRKSDKPYKKSGRSTSREERDRDKRHELTDRKSDSQKDGGRISDKSARETGRSSSSLRNKDPKELPLRESSVSNSSGHSEKSVSDVEKLQPARDRMEIGAGAGIKPRSGRESPQPVGERPGRGAVKSRRGQKEEVVRRSGGGLTDVSINDVTPLCHSSPIRGQRAITPTIQQVVTERLFNGSSVNETTADVTERKEDEPVQSQEDDVTGSDGEEFPGDDLLQELRARHEHFQQRLEILNQLINLASE